MNMILSPYKSEFLGQLKSRVVMTAMTRGFAKDHKATPLMAEYYARRANDGVGLLLTEGTVIHKSGDGYNNVPHIETQEQAETWKPILEKVHEAGSKIACQLWHCGRISHPDFTGGVAPVSSTNKPAEGLNRQNSKPYGKPQVLKADEIPGIIHLFNAAAKNALGAGFDAVEIHAGHGYLIDEFFDASVNDRTDRYGGRVENRCRFGLELTKGLIKVHGADKVILRISPSRDLMGKVHDWPDMKEMLEYLIPELDRIGLRMLDVSCASVDWYKSSARALKLIRPLWKHLIISGASLSLEQAEAEVRKGTMDLVTWGRNILANPDFVSKLKKGAELKEFDREMLSTLY